MVNGQHFEQSLVLQYLIRLMTLSSSISQNFAKSFEGIILRGGDRAKDTIRISNLRNSSPRHTEDTRSERYRQE